MGRAVSDPTLTEASTMLTQQPPPVNGKACAHNAIADAIASAAFALAIIALMAFALVVAFGIPLAHVGWRTRPIVRMALSRSVDLRSPYA